MIFFFSTDTLSDNYLLLMVETDKIISHFGILKISE